MKNKKFDYSPFSSFQIRTPLFPLITITKLFGKENSLQDLIDYIVENSFLQEALLIASPQLLDIILNCNPETMPDKKQSSLKSSLCRYIVRSATRSTPYGLFAGISIGMYSQSTNLVRHNISELKRSSKLDIRIQMKIVKNLLSDRTTGKYLKLFPNNSIYVAKDHLRYLKTDSPDNSEHSIAGVKVNDHLTNVLDHTKEGKTIVELSKYLINTIENISVEQSFDYIKLLILENLLISEWSLSTNQQDLLHRIIEKLSSARLPGNNLEKVKKLKRVVDNIDKHKVNTNSEKKELNATLNYFNIETDKKNIISVDTYLPFKNDMLNKKISFQTLRVMRDLNQIFPNPENGNLKRFRDTFKKRYGNQKIPLSLALDTESGIKYSRDQKHSELFNFFSIDTTHILASQSNQVFNWSPTTAKLNEILQAASRASEQEIVLNADDFHRHNSVDELPRAISAFIELYSEGSQDLIYFKLAFAQSAAKMFSRFSHLDKKQEVLINEIMTEENDISDHEIAAEIVHIPNAHAANILQKPELRPFEIPYGTLSHLTNQRQLPVSDLMLSMEDGNLILTSKRLKKKVVPFMSSAHNFKNNPLPIYHFLNDLSTQNTISRIGFDWGCLDIIYDFLPRVLIGKVIVSKARWRLSNKPLLEIFRESKNKSYICEKIENWRTKFSLPKQAHLREGDKLLFFDFEKYDLVMTFFDSIKSQKIFILEESFLNKDSPVLDEEGLSYANELIIPFYKN